MLPISSCILVFGSNSKHFFEVFHPDDVGINLRVLDLFKSSVPTRWLQRSVAQHSGRQLGSTSSPGLSLHR